MKMRQIVNTRIEYRPVTHAQINTQQTNYRVNSIQLQRLYPFLINKQTNLFAGNNFSM